MMLRTSASRRTNHRSTKARRPTGVRLGPAAVVEGGAGDGAVDRGSPQADHGALHRAICARRHVRRLTGEEKDARPCVRLRCPLVRLRVRHARKRTQRRAGSPRRRPSPCCANERRSGRPAGSAGGPGISQQPPSVKGQAGRHGRVRRPEAEAIAAPFLAQQPGGRGRRIGCPAPLHYRAGQSGAPAHGRTQRHGGSQRVRLGHQA